MATNTIVYRDYVFQGSDIQDGNPYTEVSLPSSALGSNTIQVTVKCNDPAIVDFQRNDPLLYTRENHLPERYFVQSISRVGTNRYTISATSIVGLLEQMEHKGGIYTGQTVPEVVGEICGSLPVKVKTIFQDTALYGWLPYVKPPESSARDNLAQVLFAIGAYLGVDQEGVLRVEPLWDGVSSAVTADRVYNDGSVDYGSAVSSVSVLEHQYLDIDTEDTTTLFDGTATANTTVIFDDPMFNLQATGFSILESGANYAVLSAGTGTLMGIPYLHTTREVVRTVTPGATENVKTISDATLVSLVNSQAVAERMAEYYKHTVTINNPILAESERAGHVVSIYDPYDRIMVNACISSMDVTMSAKARAETAALVGFRPPQPGTIPYYDFHEILTGSGEWTVPDGVEKILAVLISAGDDGKDGNDATSFYVNGNSNYSNLTYPAHDISTKQLTANATSTTSGGPSEPGSGGSGGLGGKILQIEIDVQGLQTVSYTCGTTASKSTIFGSESSENGSISSVGYTDIVTGIKYAVPGIDGANGGAGGSAGENGESVGQSLGGNGENAFQETGRDSDTDGGFSVNLSATFSYSASGGGGAGGNSGDNLGDPGGSPRYSASPTTKISNIYSFDVIGYGIIGGTGGDGANGEDGLTYGSGGNGGGGGGAAGAYGPVSISSVAQVRATSEKNYSQSFRLEVLADRTESFSGVPGIGGKGGKGANGCIILFYEAPGPPVLVEAAVTSDQKWRLDKYGRRCIV